MNYEYKVVDARLTTPTTLVLTLFAKHPRRIMPYKPGQYVALSFNHRGPTPARCFSITSSPLDTGWLQLGLRVKGDFTTSAAKYLKAGDTVKIKGPFGGFVLNPFRDRAVVMLAGGIGITPFMSMVRAASTARVPTDMVLVYSSRDQDDVAFADELMVLARTNPFLHVVFVVGDGPANRFSANGFPVVQGRLTPEVLDSLLGGFYRGRTFFLCGPPPFMSSLTEGLHKRHVPQRRIVTEVFSQYVPKTSPFLGRPSQVYALSALSLLIGTAMIFNQDVRAVKQPATDDSGDILTKNGMTTGTNSRQDELNKQIGELQGNGSSTSDGSSTGNGTVPTSDTDTSGIDPSPSPTPGTSPSPNPSPTPTPARGTTKPTPAPPPPPPPPPPSPTPVAPVFYLRSNTTSIMSGATATLSWAITNSASAPVTCAASGGWSGSRATSGTYSVAPASTTTYTLTCSNKAGGGSQSVTISVTQPPPPPPPAPPPPPPPPPSSGGS